MKIKKQKNKSELSIIQKELWELCKRIIRYRDGSQCYTCRAEGLQGSNQQTGHFIASSICGAYLRYDLRNLAVQCMRCNVRLSGNGACFYRRLVEDRGQAFVDGLFADKQRTTKTIDHVRRLLQIYKNIAEELFTVERKHLFGNIDELEEKFCKNI